MVFSLFYGIDESLFCGIEVTIVTAALILQQVNSIVGKHNTP
jgi:hypothetical protein